jgi:hypothetical protein
VKWTAFAFTASNFRDGSYVMNRSGATTFLGFLTGPGVTSANHQGIWSEGAGTQHLLARMGSAAPGAGGALYDSFTTGGLSMNNSGKVTFISILSGTGVTSSNNRAVYSDVGGSVQLVARAGGGRFKEFVLPTINDAGQIGFYAVLDTGASPQGLWIKRNGGIDAVAINGDQAPGTASGVTFNGFSPFDRPIMNESGKVVFPANLTGPGVTSSNNSGIWSDVSGALSLIARKGSPAPSIAGSITFASVGSPVLSDCNALAFSGQTAVMGSSSQLFQNRRYVPSWPLACLSSRGENRCEVCVTYSSQSSKPFMNSENTRRDDMLMMS